MFYKRLNRIHGIPWDRLILTIIILIGVLLRLYHLSHKSLWIDEIGQAQAASGSFLGAIKGSTTHIAAAPLDYAVTNLILHFTHTEYALRLPSVIWGVLSILAIFMLSKTLSESPWMALGSAYLAAVTPTLIEFSQELRFYSLFVLLSILCVYTFVAAFNSDRKIWWILFTLVMLLAFYTHYFSALLTAAIGIFLLLALAIRKVPILKSRFLNWEWDLKSIFFKFILSTTVILLLFLPWFVFTKNSLISPFEFQFPSSNYLFAVPFMGPRLPDYLLGLQILPVFAFVGLVFGKFKRHSYQLLLGLLIALPFTGVLLADWLFSYFVSYRQFLFILPFYIILIAAGLTSIARFVSRDHFLPRIVATGVLFAILTFFLIPHLKVYYDNPPRENWRDTALFLKKEVQRNSALIFSQDDLANYILFYQPALAKHVVSNPEFFNDTMSNDYRRLWVISYSPDFVTQVSNQMGWSGASVNISLCEGIPLYYLGPGDHTSLLQEVSQKDVPPEAGVHTQLLYLLFNTNPSQAVELGQKLISRVNLEDSKIFNNEKAVLLTNVARLYFDMGQADPALKLSMESMSFDVTSRDALNNIGYILVNLGRCEEAIPILQKSAKYNSNSFWAHFLLANAYSCNQFWSKAAQEYSRSYAIEPKPELLLAQAQMYIHEGESRRAVQVLEEIIKVYPDSPASEQSKNTLESLNQQ